MGHLDDLDEYEAERELELKREYQAVFPLFRYSVLTVDGAYLCNTLDVQSEPMPEGRPLYHLYLQDAWIWDANRPRRLLERVEVHTDRDITIEELRSDDGRQLLTPEDVVRRLDRGEQV